MDRIIKEYASVPFGELNYCFKQGIMYQRDTTASVEYDQQYFENYVHLEGSEIAEKLNAGRTSITEKYCNSLLDIGIGSGEFIKKSKIHVLGFDINPVGIEWLKERNLFADPYVEMPEVDGLTFWDAIEHFSDPNALLSLIRPGMYAFVSLPIFDNLLKIRQSKHYKPNEHYLYFTALGLIEFFNDSGFNLVEMSDQEMRAGRDSIGTFVFRKF